MLDPRMVAASIRGLLALEHGEAAALPLMTPSSQGGLMIFAMSYLSLGLFRDRHPGHAVACY